MNQCCGQRRLQDSLILTVSHGKRSEQGKEEYKMSLSGIRKCNVGAKSCAQGHGKLKEKPDAKKKRIGTHRARPHPVNLATKKGIKGRFMQQRTVATTQITGALVRGGQGPSQASSRTWQYQSCGSGLPLWLEKPLRPGMWQGSPRVGAVTEKPGLY